MLAQERRDIVDLIVDNHVQVLLGVVLCNFLQGEFLGLAHYELRWCVYMVWN